MSSTFNKRAAAGSKSKVEALASWNIPQVKSLMSPCISMSLLHNLSRYSRASHYAKIFLVSVRENYEHFKANPPPQRMESYTDGYGADANRGNPYAGYGRSGSYSVQSPYSATPSTPAPGTSGGAQSDTATNDYYAQYYANQPGGDPYAAYGGYAAYAAYYQQYYQQAQQQQPPPPADAGQVPPPPPPGM